ncbi:MAG: hypothetical protein GTO14_21165 [Anaerolineales bacterium]|nr:hypothetical protein [Anaerolineales bacterium]
MTKANFEIVLREGEMESGMMRYEPGGYLRGSVQVTPVSDLNCRHLNARLVWRTEGRGDRDREIVDELDLFQGLLRAGDTSYHTFHFNMPQEPWSYAGYYVNIIWELEVAIDVPMAADPKASEVFILAPRRD